MAKMKPLTPPDKKDLLRIDCRECGTLVRDFCGKTGKPIEECQHGEKQSYKVIVNEPNTGRRRTKNLLTRILKEARPEAALFWKKVKEGKTEAEEFVMPAREKQEDHPLLIDAMAQHIAFLSGENVPSHKKHIRQQKHINQASSVYQDLIALLKAKRYPVTTMTPKEIGDTEVGLYHQHLKSKGVSGRTYDLKMGMLKTLYNFLRKENPTEKNPFSGLTKQTRYKDVPIITKEEFKLLEAKLQERKWGKDELNPASIKVFYRELLLKAIRLGLFSGRRLEELCMARYKDITTDENGNMLSLTVIDFKVSRKQNRMDDPIKIKVPVTRQLRELLSPDFKKYKGRDKFILDPEERLDRKTLKSFISHSFRHHWKELGIDKNVSFKTLRATHISHLANFLGLDRSRLITGHSGNDVLTRHYISQEVIAHSVKHFGVYEEELSREEELQKLRKSEKQQMSLEK